MAEPILPVLRYPGSKWSMAQDIIKHFPPHDTYVEPFFGGGSVFWTKLPAKYEVINDRSLVVVNFYRTCRDHPDELARMVDRTPYAREEYENSYTLTGDPVEDARRFLVRVWQSYGVRLTQHTGWRTRGSSQASSFNDTWNDLPERIRVVGRRLKNVEIENREAVDVIERFSDQDDALCYSDPPYIMETRSGNSYYYHEMSDQEHFEFLQAMVRFKGPAVISGYDHGLYDYVLKGWYKESIDAMAEQHQPKKEILWMNRRASYAQQASFDI